VARDATPIAARLHSTETHELLNYARIPLRAVVALHETRLLPALGLTRGFNALDGD